MILLKEDPYFMQNEEWYYHDNKKGMYMLTDKATEEARKSHEEFYRMIEATK